MTTPNDPFEDPGSSSGNLQYPPLQGSLLIVQVDSFEEHVPTVFTEPGEKNPAVRATITVVDGPQAGTIYDDTLIFPRALVAQLRNRVGKIVLGRLGQGDARPGQNPPWKLLAASEADKAKARQVLATAQAATAVASSEPPF